VCDEVVVALPPGFDLPLGGTRRVDDLPGGGALAGLLAGFGVAPFDHAVALGVDYPLMTAPVLASLVAACARAPATTALVPVVAGHPQPLAAVYAASALAPLRAWHAAGGRGLVGALDALPAVTRADEAALARLLGTPALAAFTHVNQPADLAHAERLAAGSAA
jgi:molybdopterin-guanine dinucleotide biosynthesis protein A